MYYTEIEPEELCCNFIMLIQCRHKHIYGGDSQEMSSSLILSNSPQTCISYRGSIFQALRGIQFLINLFIHKIPELTAAYTVLKLNMSQVYVLISSFMKIFFLNVFGHFNHNVELWSCRFVSRAQSHFSEYSGVLACSRSHHGVHQRLLQRRRTQPVRLSFFYPIWRTKPCITL